MDLLPVSIERLADAGIRIQWNDGTAGEYKTSALRTACPCATCREKKSAAKTASPMMLPVLSAAEAQPLTITGMRPVGNYAYNIAFSDGHDSGIFTFEFLRGMADEANH